MSSKNASSTTNTSDTKACAESISKRRCRLNRRLQKLHPGNEDDERDQSEYDNTCDAISDITSHYSCANVCMEPPQSSLMAEEQAEITEGEEISDRQNLRLISAQKEMIGADKIRYQKNNKNEEANHRAINNKSNQKISNLKFNESRLLDSVDSDDSNAVKELEYTRRQIRNKSSEFDRLKRLNTTDDSFLERGKTM